LYSEEVHTRLISFTSTPISDMSRQLITSHSSSNVQNSNLNAVDVNSDQAYKPSPIQ
jgi:hypothetical protein